MFTLGALLCICTAYLVSSGPVGISLCHVLCDRDCSCSTPHYDPVQMVCSFTLNPSVPATWNGQKKCTSGSCRAVHTRRGAVICVKQYSDLVREKNTVVKNLRKKQKKSCRFVIASSREVMMSKKGFQIKSFTHLDFQMERVSSFTLRFYTTGKCHLIINMSFSSTLKYLAKNCRKVLGNKMMLRLPSASAYVTLTWTKQEMTCTTWNSKGYSSSIPAFRHVIRADMNFIDLAVNVNASMTIVQAH